MCFDADIEELNIFAPGGLPEADINFDCRLTETARKPGTPFAAANKDLGPTAAISQSADSQSRQNIFRRWDHIA